MPTSPLVGRELDIALALEQLKRVEGGATASLLVRGDPGIGKSRLVTEVVDRARQLGHSVLLGRADDLDAGIPYAVFRDLLARVADDAAFDGRRDLVDRFSAALEGDVGGDSRDDRHLAAVFATAASLLRDLASDRAVVLVLEDLHVADRESLALISPLARLAGAAVLTVVTMRPIGRAEDVQRLFEQMAEDGRGATIELDPLDRHDTQALVASVLGAAPDDALTDVVFAASQGNPFFAQEVAQSLTDSGAIVVDAGRARVLADAPAVGLRPSTALLRRLFGGTSDDVELAKVMAVFGRFALRHLGLVQRLVGGSDAEVSRSFDRLVKLGVLTETAEGYGFTHPIVRDTLYEDIGPAERRRIHGAIAAELSADRRTGVLLEVLELATHVSASAERGDEAAAEVLIDAGRSLAATAPLVSAGYQRRAAELLPADSPRRVDALAMEARALHLGARSLEAADVGREALAGLQQGSARSAVAAIVASGLYWAGRIEEAIDVTEAELELDAASAPLLALQVDLYLQASRHADAAAGFATAMAALDAATPAGQMMALSHLVQYANHVGSFDIASDLLTRLAALPTGASPTVQLAVHELMAFADWRAGLVDRIESHLAAARERRPDDATLSIGGTFESAHARALWMSGRWDEALELIRSASFDMEQRGLLVGAQLLLSAGCEILIDRGAVEQATTMIQQLVTPIMTLRRNAALVRAQLAHALGDHAEAERLLVEERDADPDGSVWKMVAVHAALFDLYVEQDRWNEARAAAELIERLAERSQWPEDELPALRCRAIVDRDVDAAHAYRNRATEERWESERARSLLVLGELDVDSGVNLTEAYRAFDALGAAPWRRRAAAALRSRGLTVPRRVTKATSVLTDTEVQLVRLVCEGLSNRQIATALHYSPKTIEVYLSRLYVKTGCASRLALVRAVDTGAVDLVT
jgi:DNA-binding CsgD family transcriptional regulator/tetratricopeptide (TPR) repeat protein